MPRPLKRNGILKQLGWSIPSVLFGLEHIIGMGFSLAGRFLLLAYDGNG